MFTLPRPTAYAGGSDLSRWLEPETRADHGRSSGTRHDVSAADAIEIEGVRQVVEIELEIDVLRNRIRSHQIKSPISVDKACIDCVAVALPNKPGPAAETKALRKAIGGPEVEGVARRVNQFLADLGRSI